MRSFPPRRACVALALVASLVAPSDVSASSLPPPWEDYHTSDEIFAEFARLADAHPALVRWDLVSESRPPDASSFERVHHFQQLKPEALRIISVATIGTANDSPSLTNGSKVSPYLTK